jgi:hypothetical protein
LENLGCIISKSDNVGKKEDLEDISNEAKNHMMMLAKGNILNTFQMKVKNLHKPLIAIIQNVMMLNFSLQVKKKI